MKTEEQEADEIRMNARKLAHKVVRERDAAFLYGIVVGISLTLAVYVICRAVEVWQ